MYILCGNPPSSAAAVENKAAQVEGGKGAGKQAQPRFVIARGTVAAMTPGAKLLSPARFERYKSYGQGTRS